MNTAHFDGTPDLTYGQQLAPVVEITDSNDAAQYLTAYAAWLQRKQPGRTLEEATTIAKGNIGYWSGYYSPDTMQRVLRVFDVAHPIFGGAR